jgi:cation diffusion facilitator CzcD-associated flavoprotein CzcO
MSSTDTQAEKTVLIVGAGLGGVMLGLLLERASIPYLIFERATTVKPLGNIHVVVH